MKPETTSLRDHAQAIRSQLEPCWLPDIYRERILKMRTRSYDFPSMAKEAAPEIQHTLLGIELKVGRKRMLCPDLSTARYLAVFARAGCKSIAIPYDITRISHLADELESSWHRMLLLADRQAARRGVPFRTRVRRLLRESFRLHQHELAQPLDLVLVARPSIVGKGFAGVEKDFLTTLRKAGLLRANR